MNYENEQLKANSFFAKGLAILQKKANDYAQDNDCFSNFKKIALVCELPTEKVFLVFMLVKIARIIELLKKRNQVAESKQDSLIDIANYACLMSMYLDDK